MRVAGDLWAEHILENARAYIMTFVYISTTIVSRFPLAYVIAHAVGMSKCWIPCHTSAQKHSCVRQSKLCQLDARCRHTNSSRRLTTGNNSNHRGILLNRGSHPINSRHRNNMETHHSSHKDRSQYRSSNNNSLRNRPHLPSKASSNPLLVCSEFLPPYTVVFSTPVPGLTKSDITMRSN